MKSNFRRTAFILLCVAPAVILFTIFMVVPTFNVFRLSRISGAHSIPMRFLLV